jgi:hypothetical protein
MDVANPEAWRCGRPEDCKFDRGPDACRFGPLERLAAALANTGLPDEWHHEFMWMGPALDQADLGVYKHYWTRRSLVMDTQGHLWDLAGPTMVGDQRLPAMWEPVREPIPHIREVTGGVSWRDFVDLTDGGND